MDDVIGSMDLPLVNPQEDLETISNNYLRPLFEVRLFELRSESFRDKGIDFSVELKKDDKYTNFRFLIQLKATNSVGFNQDGSFSLSVSTSNIQYLLNGGVPAYYILFVKSKNQFFYEDLNEFLFRLSDKNNEWQQQASHTIRFQKELNKSALSEIYKKTLQHGLFRRKIEEKLIYKSAAFESGDKILIDVNMNVTDDSDIRNIIENIGFDLINETRWKEILELHKKASGSVAISAKYNLIVGIAYYHTSNFIDALSHFKKAILLRGELPNSLLNHLHYFDVTIKYSLGIVDEDKYNEIINELDKDDEVGLFIRIQKVKDKYLSSIKDLKPNAYNEFANDINLIINNPLANANTKLFARSELMYHEGMKNNMDSLNGVVKLHELEQVIGPNLEFRIEAANRFILINKTWLDNSLRLINDAINQKYYFTYHIAYLYSVKVKYNFIVHLGSFKVMEDLPGYPPQTLADNTPMLHGLIKTLDEITLYFQQMGHMQNVCVTLLTKYELLHYIKQYIDTNNVVNELKAIITVNDLHEQKESLDLLLNKGTTHERFSAFFIDTFKEAEKIKGEIKHMVDEMDEMDIQDRKKKESGGQRATIHLVPIGYFKFPIAEADKMFSILNVGSPQAKSVFESLFNQKIIPVANISYNPIMQEGPIDGHVAKKGIDAWKNIYRIRKAFYEENYFRVELKP